MRKLFWILSSVAVLAFSAAPACAATITEDFVFSYTNPTGSSFTLSYLFYGTNPFGQNLLSELQTDVGKSFSGSGSLSQLVTIDPSQTYYSIAGINGTVESYRVTVSAVPLPASFPLFGLALVALAVFGYRSRREVWRLPTAA